MADGPVGSSDSKRSRREALVRGQEKVISLLEKVLQNNQQSPPKRRKLAHESSVSSSSSETSVSDDSYNSSDDEQSARLPAGDRWDMDIAQAELKVLAMCSKDPWVSTSHFGGSRRYPWSRRIVAMRKLGLLRNEQEIARARHIYRGQMYRPNSMR